MRFWRISSTNKLNLELAFRSHLWGGREPSTLGRLIKDDRIAFYVSGKQDQGYWAIGTVGQPVFESRKRIWPDDLYPFRIRFSLDHRPLMYPIPREKVLRRLQQERFLHMNPRAIIQLEPREFRTIERLVRTAALSKEVEVG